MREETYTDCQNTYDHPVGYFSIVKNSQIWKPRNKTNALSWKLGKNPHCKSLFRLILLFQDSMPLFWHTISLFGGNNLYFKTSLMMYHHDVTLFWPKSSLLSYYLIISRYIILYILYYYVDMASHYFELSCCFEIVCHHFDILSHYFVVKTCTSRCLSWCTTMM